ncbi:DUF1206 domain-containing protein [Nocardioides campestrisoli]|uniref:DUF1206 domain-containing protein n=1 Tax=Nocardioides campestrisoli TaxID=2736757 RepID=UPI0015E789A3|nr:DUF1206 domain-containing protein [Nocardioides campestrisoli]
MPRAPGGHPGSVVDISSKARRAGDSAEDSPWLDVLIRVGLVAYGITHLLIGWVALQLAWGSSSSGKASSEGAFQQLTSSGLGTALLWGVAVGLVLLVLWRLLEAAFGHEDKDSTERWVAAGGSLLKAALYGALAFTAFRTLLGSGGGGGKPFTAQVMSWPAGQWLVVFGGLCVIGYGGLQIYRGVSKKFLEHLDQSGRIGEIGRAYKWFGIAGYVSKGVAVGIVGVLIVHAGWTHEGKDQGLDDALAEVLQQPFGPWLLSVIALGIACYGLFSFARAKHLDR